MFHAIIYVHYKLICFHRNTFPIHRMIPWDPYSGNLWDIMCVGEIFHTAPRELPQLQANDCD